MRDAALRELGTLIYRVTGALWQLVAERGGRWFNASPGRPFLSALPPVAPLASNGQV